mmetsp:Transcript_63174/g.105089  ORF Transcript_63174/g.105089 Transcript_63174/m.105089 type:complete len:172 (+) Transcript_63174:65-580(+)|eukprot:CAMPEP_0119307422 /NCGR_PEP_ID=MMETSP1333-20130426/7933_1 /TAXON_ID=418940 /ORGANISM="Scyphosphaera apsteinii, Strain RCC1455" /LENGTH=171 /DNA_ID=CAMNT_0007310971 /DNA_START=41 /DNA_END=556 /DNA_ORIENTATION=+
MFATLLHHIVLLSIDSELLDPVMGSYDTNADGQISPQELADYVARRATRDCSQLAQSLQEACGAIENRKASRIAHKLMLALDSNGDGRACIDEFNGYMKTQMQRSIKVTDNLSKAEIQRLLEEKHKKEERKASYRVQKRHRAITESRSTLASDAAQLNEQAQSDSCFPTEP